MCTWRRRRWLTTAPWAETVSVALLHAAEHQGYDIDAYCLMPDHLHVLVSAEGPSSGAAAFVHRFKQATGFSLARHLGHPVWQRSFFDRSLRSDEAVLPVIAYLLANPIRAGLVRRVSDWPWWGSSRWSREELLEALSEFPRD